MLAHCVQASSVIKSILMTAQKPQVVPEMHWPKTAARPYLTQSIFMPFLALRLYYLGRDPSGLV